MSSSPRFCGSCGARLAGGRFCGGCGAAVAGFAAAAPPQPQPQAMPAVAAAGPYPAPQPLPAPPPAYQPPAPPAYQPPPPAAPPAYGQADWTSTKVQPGETELGTWMVAMRKQGPDVTGALTVTDLRIIFKPKVAGTSLVGMAISQLPSYKARYTVVLRRDQVVDIRFEKRMVNNWIHVTTVDGFVASFNRGLMSPEPVLAVLQPR